MYLMRQPVVYSTFFESLVVSKLTVLPVQIQPQDDDGVESAIQYSCFWLLLTGSDDDRSWPKYSCTVASYGLELLEIRVTLRAVFIHSLVEKMTEPTLDEMADYFVKKIFNH